MCIGLGKKEKRLGLRHPTKIISDIWSWPSESSKTCTPLLTPTLVCFLYRKHLGHHYPSSTARDTNLQAGIQNVIPKCWFTVVSILDRCGNDPSAGSPTETLLRLHLPLNDKVQTSSRDESENSPQSRGFTGPFNR